MLRNGALAITSENKRKTLIQYKSTHFKYALTYVFITLAVLLFLNLYSSKTSQKIFYQSKEAAMMDKCILASNEIAKLPVVNPSTVEQSLESIASLRVDQIIVTDESLKIIYNSVHTAEDVDPGDIAEITDALTGNDVFSWHFTDGIMVSKAAVPVISYGTTIGCVYMIESDAQQGALLQSLQVNIFTVTLILEVFLILFSLFFSRTYTARLRRVMESIRIIRDGDYTHVLKMGGNDELTVLGDEFNDLVKRLQVSEDKRRRFVSDASHELKTPLASIKLLSDSILQNEMDIDTAKEFVADIGNEAERLNRMTQKLLTLTHSEVPPDEAFEITYIAPTIERVAKMLSTIADENNIDIQLELLRDSTILILEDDLYQIIFNLVENGIKYNTVNGTLRISLNRLDDNAQIIFADTGVGIPQSSISHIFERFYRVDKARSRQSGGSGLGLSIVRSIVERNAGTIQVESTEGKGTVFTVSFPVFDTDEDHP